MDICLRGNDISLYDSECFRSTCISFTICHYEVIEAVVELKLCLEGRVDCFKSDRVDFCVIGLVYSESV